MSTQISSASIALFQQIFAAFCVLMAEICISLFFRSPASKTNKKLITIKLPIFRKYKPNRENKLFLWRYSDTKSFLVLNQILQDYQQLQTFILLRLSAATTAESKHSAKSIWLIAECGLLNATPFDAPTARDAHRLHVQRSL
jgi:hypothetical protein